MKIKYYLLFLLLFSLASEGISQTTIVTKVAGLLHHPTYVDIFYTYQTERQEAGIGLALAFRKALDPHFAMGTEFGFNTFNTQVELTSDLPTIRGNHSYQQMYVAFIPHYSLLKKRDWLFINAGFAIFVNTKSELYSPFGGNVPMNIGNVTTGILGGIGTNLHSGNMGFQLEIRSNFQSATPSSEIYNGQRPEKFNLYYTSISGGITYHFGK